MRVTVQLLAMTAVTAMAIGLSGCGGGKVDEAVKLCQAEVERRTASEMGTVTAADLKQAAREEPDGSIRIESKVYYRKGTPQQQSQTFNCLVAFPGGGSPSLQGFIIQPFFDP